MDGLAYCFLPLPVRTQLPCHINGYFELNRYDLPTEQVPLPFRLLPLLSHPLCLTSSCVAKPAVAVKAQNTISRGRSRGELHAAVIDVMYGVAQICKEWVR